MERVTADGASIVYVFGSRNIRPTPQRLQAKFVGDELHGGFSNGNRFAYRHRPDGALEFLFVPSRGNSISGILLKEK